MPDRLSCAALGGSAGGTQEPGIARVFDEEPNPFGMRRETEKAIDPVVRSRRFAAGTRQYSVASLLASYPTRRDPAEGGKGGLIFGGLAARGKDRVPFPG